MPALARATATLPRSWSSKNSLHAMAMTSTRREEGANKTRLILRKYLDEGIDPPADVLDELEPTKFGSLSSHSSISRGLCYLGRDEEDSPRRGEEMTKRVTKIGERRSDFADVLLPPSPRARPSGSAVFKAGSSATERSLRHALVRKQTRRQSLSPAFFDPDTIPVPSSTPTVPGAQAPTPPSASARKRAHRASILHGTFPKAVHASAPLKLTAAALELHVNPAAALLSVPISSALLSGSGPGDVISAGEAREKALRRSASFCVASKDPDDSEYEEDPEPPEIRITKAPPTCLEEHSNESSRDPFYLEKLLRPYRPTASKQPSLPNRQAVGRGRPCDPTIRPEKGLKQKGSSSSISVGSGGATAAVLSMYID